MSDVRITVGNLEFFARWEAARAPATCAAFRKALPVKGKMVQARWSGEAAWIPLGDLNLGIAPENPVSTPGPGQILFYPKGISETEILFPYGVTRFASVFGPLAGNHFLTLTDGIAQLETLGRRVLWEGAQQVEIMAT